MNNFSVQGLRPVLVVGYTLWPLGSLRVSLPLMAKVTWMPSKHEMRYLIKGRKEGVSYIRDSGRSEGYFPWDLLRGCLSLH